jgi:hypothetical protein
MNTGPAQSSISGWMTTGKGTSRDFSGAPAAIILSGSPTGGGHEPVLKSDLKSDRICSKRKSFINPTGGEFL